MKPIVYLYYVKYAKDTQGAAAIMDAARNSGADSVSAKWERDTGMWKIEYTLPRDNDDD